ncbi:hypothetical protein BLNAU_8509 [Blattamonas nauphoetae]|nr:hypothetical protein BLNAU_18270 [Blattamonas nauphoetae]KAK2956455.1 hypothetical protein BLNAU_8509 [Blattamonas nauphoetae]
MFAERHHRCLGSIGSNHHATGAIPHQRENLRERPARRDAHQDLNAAARFFVVAKGDPPTRIAISGAFGRYDNRSYDLSDVSDSVTLLRDVGGKGSFTDSRTSSDSDENHSLFVRCEVMRYHQAREHHYRGSNDRNHTPKVSTNPVGCALSPTSYQYTQYETELELAHLKQFYKIRILRNSRDDCFVSNTTDVMANACNCYGFYEHRWSLSPDRASEHDDAHQRVMPTLSCLNSTFIIIVDTSEPVMNLSSLFVDVIYILPFLSSASYQPLSNKKYQLNTAVTPLNVIDRSPLENRSMNRRLKVTKTTPFNWEGGGGWMKIRLLRVLLFAFFYHRDNLVPTKHRQTPRQNFRDGNCERTEWYFCIATPIISGTTIWIDSSNSTK